MSCTYCWQDSHQHSACCSAICSSQPSASVPRHHQLKTEGQCAGFHAGKCADLQPHAGNPTCAGLLRLLFNNFQRPLAKSDFVHGRLRIAMGHICNNDARSSLLSDQLSMTTADGCHRHVSTTPCFIKVIKYQQIKIWHGKCLYGASHATGETEMTIWEISERRTTSPTVTAAIRISGASTAIRWFRASPCQKRVCIMR